MPVGGKHITADIAHGLNVSLVTAERIKTLYGSALATPVGEREQFEVPVFHSYCPSCRKLELYALKQVQILTP